MTATHHPTKPLCQHHEQRHPVPAVGLLGSDDQGFGHLGDAGDDVVDVGAAQAHALPIEGGVRAAGDDDAAVVGDGDPVAVAPDSGNIEKYVSR